MQMAAQRSDTNEPLWLSALLEDIAEVPVGSDRAIMGLTADSRRVRPGDLFFACRGHNAKGHEFISDAVRYGAVAVVYDAPLETAPALSSGVPLIGVENLSFKIGAIADRFYGHPSRDISVVGVTGTNGKTSTTHFIAHALSKGVTVPCGLIGTLGSGLYGNLGPGLNTTPDAVSLQTLLAEVRDAGSRHAVMEVSSHGLAQGRVEGVHFDIAAFTNLTRDHLDYHGDMANYARAKRRLFAFPGLRSAVINLDDAEGWTLLNILGGDVGVIGYTLSSHGIDIERKLRAVRPAALLRAQIRASTRVGLELDIESHFGSGRLSSSLLGSFNASNLLAALGVLLASNLSFEDALGRLATVRSVAGRLEGFGGQDGKPLVVVDYAHTPDALEKALATLRSACTGRLWCVFGCGGNRDRGKRPQMGAIAERLADRVIITDDNPRHEDPAAIVAEILAGTQQSAHISVIHSRADAIAFAMSEAAADDVVLVAGKGHEDYQEVCGQRRFFSDRQQVAWLLGEAVKR